MRPRIRPRMTLRAAPAHQEQAPDEDPDDTRPKCQNPWHSSGPAPQEQAPDETPDEAQDDTQSGSSTPSP